MRSAFKVDHGVSPVIAVILMVAITVVLAGVVFIWAQSFTNEVESKQDFVNLKAEAMINNAGDQILSFTVISGSMVWTEYKLSINDIFITNNENDETGAGEDKEFLVDPSEVDWDIGDHLEIQIIDIFHDKIIWENGIIVKHIE